MKKLFFVAAAALMLAGCGKEGYDWGSKEEPGANEYGQVTLSVNEGNSISVKSETGLTEADGNYTVTTSNQSGKVLELSGSYSSIKGKTVTVPAGAYEIYAENMEASAAESANNGRGAAHFAGSSSFTVENGKSQQASVTCTMANAKVTFDYDDATFGNMFDLNATGEGQPTIVATPTNSITAGRSVTLLGNIAHDSIGADSYYTVDEEGTELNFTIKAKRVSDGVVKTYASTKPVTLAAKTWHKVKITASTTQGQATVIAIYVDGNIIEAEEVVVDVNPYE